MDIGRHASPHCWTGWHRCETTVLAATLACIVVFATDANAQCSAHGNHPTLKTLSPATSPAPVRSADAVAAWKAIKVGTFANTFALRNALDAAGCTVGDYAAQLLARPAFILSATKMDVELALVSAAELGFQNDTIPLADIYARAQQLGFELAPAEAAPQLRLQYSDQPLGELVIAMEPIQTWAREPIILTVANGGTGLVLLGRDGRPDAQIPAVSRFVFVRSKAAALAKAARGFDEAAAFVRH